MRSSFVVLLLVSSLSCGIAQARTLEATSDVLLRALERSLDFTSDTTTSIRDMKVVQAARDDAASFVASDEQIRGAQLEAAFAVLRTHSAAARAASDRALAEALLAQ